MISPRSARLLVAVALSTAVSACDSPTAPIAAGGTSENHFSLFEHGTALVRRAPSLNSESDIIGNVQMMLPENVTLNGNARVWGDLLVPGTPSIKTNGSAGYDDLKTGTGSASPSNHKITLNSHARVDDIVRRTNAITIEPVAAPPAPTGTRTVVLNRSNDNVGSWSTVKHLTLNQNCGTLTVPGGTYGNLTLNRNSAVRLGVYGSTQPTVYNFQKITLNSDSRIEIVGPVIITVASFSEINSDAFVGNLFRPDWLDFRVSAGNFTLNGDAYFSGFVRVPAGHASLNSEANLVGGLEADRLTLNGRSHLTLLRRPAPPTTPSAPNVSLSPFERVDGATRLAAPAFGEVTVGTTMTFEARVSSPANTAATTVSCAATIGGVAAADYQLTWLTQTVPLAAGANGVCAFTLTVNAASAAATVSVTATSASDPDESNNTATGNLVVTPAVDPEITTDLVVRSITPLGDIVAGAEVDYTAAVGVAGGTQTSTEFACVITATRVRDNTPVTVTMLPGTATATATTDGSCRFKLGALAANGTQNEDYLISVHVDPTNANELTTGDNTKTGTQRVTPKLVDVFVGAIERVAGSTTLPLDSVAAGVTAQYVASIGVAGGSTDVSCTVNVRPRVNRLGATVITGLAGIVSGPATFEDPAECLFSVSLAGNGDFDDLYDIEVVANPVGAVELGGQPNTLSGEQLATVRVDVSMDAITMTVDGAPADPTTIAKGKTGVYHAIIRNNSARATQMRCEVFVNNSPIDLPAALDQFTLGAGGFTDCTFSIIHGSLLVSEISVVATALSPLDNTPDNNERQVVTTPVGDGKFVGVENAKVVANETRLVDPLGQLVELTSAAQNMSVTNLALFVTDATFPIGYFKLVGSASSGGVEFSRDSVGGPLDVANRGIALDPGTAATPNCIVADRSSPLFKNNHTVTLAICASPVPGEPTKQAITVSYTSAKSGNFPVALNPTLFGNSITIDVKLQWSLNGSPVGLIDMAQARIEFDLFQQNQGLLRKKSSNGCFRVFSGTDIVLGGGPTCVP